MLDLFLKTITNSTGPALWTIAGVLFAFVAYIGIALIVALKTDNETKSKRAHAILRDLLAFFKGSSKKPAKKRTKTPHQKPARNAARDAVRTARASSAWPRSRYEQLLTCMFARRRILTQSYPQHHVGAD